MNRETPEAELEALRIYGTLFEMVFTSDNYLFNGDVIDCYYKLQIKHERFADAITTKRRLIRHLKEEKTIDHQIRRAYLEIVILHILNLDIYKIEETMQQFLSDAPDAFSQDEY